MSKYALKALRAIKLTFYLIRIARYAFTDFIALTAIWGAEIQSIKRKISKEQKKAYARKLLVRFPHFKDMSLTQVNKIIDSTWNFVFNKGV